LSETIPEHIDAILCLVTAGVMRNMLKPTVVAVAALSIASGLFGATDAEAKSIRKNSPNDKLIVSFSKAHAPGQVIVSFSDRRLYHVTSRGRAVSYPIAVPRPKSRWQGTNRITRKMVNPTWTPTASMRRENPALPAVVKGGDPRNPLGKRALYLGSTLYRIHGTDAPWTIGKNVSKGCVRMHNNHVAELYTKVGVGTKVTATYKSYKTAALHPVNYYTYKAKPKRKVVRRVVRNGRVRYVAKKPQPNLLDILFGS